MVLAVLAFRAVARFRFPCLVELSCADALAVQHAELPQQQLRSLVEHRRQHQPNLDDEIAAPAGPRRRRAAAAQPETLARLRPGRHAKPRRPVDAGNLDPRAQRGFVHGDRHDQVKIVAVTPEQRMRRHVHGHVDVAGRPAHPARALPAAAEPQPRAVVDAGRHATATCSLRATDPARRSRRTPAATSTPVPRQRPQDRVKTMCPRAERTRADAVAGRTPRRRHRQRRRCPRSRGRSPA